MSEIDILQKALQLSPQERYIIIESLLKSLDQPNESIDKVWTVEAQKRVQNYRDKNVKTISFEDVFNS